MGGTGLVPLRGNDVKTRDFALNPSTPSNQTKGGFPLGFETPNVAVSDLSDPSNRMIESASELRNVSRGPSAARLAEDMVAGRALVLILAKSIPRMEVRRTNMETGTRYMYLFSYSKVVGVEGSVRRRGVGVGRVELRDVGEGRGEGEVGGWTWGDVFMLLLSACCVFVVTIVVVKVLG
ncbi:hypothetical protein M501DRAFT_738810 [Patellaria atrata CBS 101060]|uniref:Uncharacterized protein n=1 Tax=Patellaria atrata CBS 101060 TaxID=1346257 RepID=A0A9P4SBY1_9PEZI|nr:hypothetical protein M501DRAFT_738810 [Patellaria atrata CBS 101060]